MPGIFEKHPFQPGNFTVEPNQFAPVCGGQLTPGQAVVQQDLVQQRLLGSIQIQGLGAVGQRLAGKVKTAILQHLGLVVVGRAETIADGGFPGHVPGYLPQRHDDAYGVVQTRRQSLHRQNQSRPGGVPGLGGDDTADCLQVVGNNVFNGRLEVFETHLAVKGQEGSAQQRVGWLHGCIP